SPLTDLTGFLDAGNKHYQNQPLHLFIMPKNVGTVKVKKKFTTKLYIDGKRVDISEYKNLKPDENVGKVVKIPARWSTATKGKHRVKLVVDAYDDIKELHENNNVIKGSYKVVGPKPFKCEEGWEMKEDGSGCIKIWTKIEKKEDYVRPILIK